MDYQEEVIAGRLVSNRDGDEIVPALEVLVRARTEECLGHFVFKIDRGRVQSGFPYRLLADGGRVLGLHVVGVEPTVDPDEVTADGKVVSDSSHDDA